MRQRPARRSSACAHARVVAKRAARRALQAASPLAGGTARPAARPRGALGRAAASSAVPTMQALRKEVSELTLRLKELGEENRDLRELCNERGIQYEERLAARRHKRYFARLCE